SKKYYRVLTEGNAQEILSLPDEKRLQVMKALATLSKFMGCYDKWKAIKEIHQLKWTNGKNGLEVFKNIVNNDNNYVSMLKWLKKTCSAIPRSHSNILIFCTLTGLRPDESIQSIKLIQNNIDNYLDREKMMLEHFRYPKIFLRRTKQSFISIVTNSILKLANESSTINYNALRCYLKRKHIPMNMNHCRKIFATFLRNNNIEQEIIDMLQGRIPKSVFVRHYYKPDTKIFDNIRDKIDILNMEIN
ncbi:MAG: integrase, partial [Nitrososphaeraceae archaeon]|nr:integrase [Nitrososphaeraceae archaeon]